MDGFDHSGLSSYSYLFDFSLKPVRCVRLNSSPSTLSSLPRKSSQVTGSHHAVVTDSPYTSRFPWHQTACAYDLVFDLVLFLPLSLICCLLVITCPVLLTY